MRRLALILPVALLLAAAAPEPPGAQSAADRSVTLTFVGAGAGSVTLTPAGGSAVTCSAGCTQVFPEGSTVTLAPAPAASSVFGGWDGDCLAPESARSRCRPTGPSRCRSSSRRA